MTEINILEEKKEILNFKIDLINKRHQDGSLITLLQSAQDSYGYVPEKVIHYISELVRIPASEIYGVITFYSQFRLKPMGKNLIRICEGTACHVNGAKTVLSVLQDELGITVGETSEDGLFTLLSVACLGCCSLAPVMMVNETTCGNLTTEKIKRTIKECKYKEKSRVEYEKN
ncbi:MAG: NADH-quinone oxidoreductase subunit NuoE [Ignavibacteriales bacterium]|nr:NADH-quinone oxidoreductase subunit NuoE [Ignavibacteriales bacterium]